MNIGVGRRSSQEQQSLFNRRLIAYAPQHWFKTLFR